MDELKPQLHVVSCSFGKDSTAMLLKMLELGMQVDVVLKLSIILDTKCSKEIEAKRQRTAYHKIFYV